MNKLYLSENLFGKALDKKDDLYRLITCARPEIYVLSSKWNKGTLAEPSKFISFGKEKGISVSLYKGDEKGLLVSLERGNYDPDAIYILNLRKETAADLRKKRIMCLSQDDFKTEKALLIDDVIIYSPQKDENIYGWNKILSPISTLPSNTILIIDRYLFESNFNSGIKNLENILDVLLPLGGYSNMPYKVYLVIAHKKDAKDCISKCDNIIGHLKLNQKPYKIDLFLYSISSKCEKFYPLTHNRRIIVESGRLEVTFKLDAFKHQSSLCCQSLIVGHLFSKANINGYGDSAYKANYDDWEAFSAFMEECDREKWHMKYDDNSINPVVIYKYRSFEPIFS